MSYEAPQTDESEKNEPYSTNELKSLERENLDGGDIVKVKGPKEALLYVGDRVGQALGEFKGALDMTEHAEQSYKWSPTQGL